MSQFNRIMSWSKVRAYIGKTPAAETMATSLTEIGPVKDKTCVLETSEGDTLEMKATGGELIGYEEQEGTTTVTVRIIEPREDLYTLFGIGTADAGAHTVNVESHLIPDYYSLELEPKNVGGYGIRAPKCSVSFRPGYSEEEGNYVDLVFGILHGQAGYLYQYWQKPATVATPTFSPAAGTYSSTQSVTIACATDGATIHYTVDGSEPTSASSTYSTAISVSSTKTIKAIAVKTGLADSAVASALYTISG